MRVQHVNFLIVGAGQTGAAAAEALRAAEPRGSAMIVGQEVSRPYHRGPLLRDYLLRKITRAELATVPVGWFIEHRIQLRTNTRVAQIDVGRKQANFASGEIVAYDKLLIATGSAAPTLKTPGSDVANVHLLRTVEDADRVLTAIDRAKAATNRAVVVGGNAAALTVAATLSGAGLGVELVCEEKYPGESFAGEAAGRAILRAAASASVAVHAGVVVKSFEGEGRVRRVALSDETSVACDFVVVCLRGPAGRDLLRNTPIAAEKAILTDARCRTNVEGVYAAGECAAILDPLYEKHRVLDDPDSLREVGLLAGENLAGGSKEYSRVSSTSVDAFGLNLRAFGDARFVDHRLIRTLENSLIEFGVARDDRVVQVVRVGHAKDDAALQKLVADKASVIGREERFKEAGGFEA